MEHVEIFAHPVTGLYDECHHVEYQDLVNAKPPTHVGSQSLSGLNNLWWKIATSRETLFRMTDRLISRSTITGHVSRIHRIIAEDPEVFANSVQSALQVIGNLGAGPKALFSALETMNIFCALYSDFISYPHSLSLQEGFLTNELDTRILIREALEEGKNPYLSFLRTYAKPVLVEARADVLWLVGPLRTSLITLATMQREINPRCHISVIGHSTEYYSLNKIDNLLLKNDILFKLIDSIVLDDFENTVPQLRDAIKFGDTLESVPNLMFVGKDSLIKSTPYLKNSTKTIDGQSRIKSRSNASVAVSGFIDASDVVTAKLWPNSKCFWSSCNFCAINKKYNTLPVNDFSETSNPELFFENIAHSGYTFLWSIDEAIPPENLDALATRLIAKNIKIRWETRSKIHPGFTKAVCERLYKAGLREIRLGLESASPRVLEAMGKHFEGWTISLVEEVVSNFHHARISVHFPSIIGFPSETSEERQETFDFLTTIISKFPSVTFNINILGLDVASRLFKNYERFGVTEIRWPCNPRYFLGNLVDWNSADEPFNYDALDAARNFTMRELLYPWMPRTATLPVFIFYRLAETSRATLVWKAVREERDDWHLHDFDAKDKPQSVVLAKTLVCTQLSKGTAYSNDKRYLIYDWGTHHQIELDEKDYASIMRLREPAPLQELRVGELSESVQTVYDMGLLVSV